MVLWGVFTWFFFCVGGKSTKEVDKGTTIYGCSFVDFPPTQ